LCHPTLFPDLEEAFGLLDLPDDCARLRDSMAKWFHGAKALDSDDLLNHLTQSGLRDVAEPLLALMPQRAPDNDAAAMAELEASWYGIYGLMNLKHLQVQCEEQRLRFESDPTPENFERHRICVIALKRVERGESDSDAVF
ncbi:MAG: DNA primase, partial [Acidiphilium sp. 21-62-4]